MADFYQHGMITTLQRLKERPPGEIDEELVAITRKRHTVLLLPALFSEFETPSMPVIIEELKQVRYLKKIVLSLDRADERQFQRARELMSVIPTEVHVVWHDGPRMQELYRELAANDFDIQRPGKGRSVWMTLGYVLADEDVYAIALHDSDILNYNRDFLARLVYPVVHPAIDLEFSKGYYARVGDRLYGRATRLFYIPLIRTLKRILTYNPFLEYLGNFRYPLSGEFALISSLARGIRVSPTWGLEISLLSEVYQRTSANRICQVEITESYEHKHQVLDKTQPETGLIRMATDIAAALFRILSQDGILMSQSFFRTLYTAYIEESRIAIEKYHALAMINGLIHDRHAEIEAAEIFVSSLQIATEEYTRNPVGIPMLPAWVRVRAAIPDFSDHLTEAVRLDNSL
ncbi:glycosyl transferase [Syntrophus aciditrophicus]|uniref:Glycosyltransferase involved in cell wall biogenesis n=1 Tax=Syntrophus aciditrophicus (strain SB) TaxID=56780 RepID=Q2LX75_SYNAS|nr:glycosyl transferase [Syntrophus aciditrophicus]ABC78682.1 glycosyltransferase involved in cell wall biogenesis [Syntrophus aciditrophicus SB]OPY16362.1 MAG: Glucosyl-3-phosphoglycerate synthase [Syntrophus sp. PtaB.Bin075]